MDNDALTPAFDLASYPATFVSAKYTISDLGLAITCTTHKSFVEACASLSISFSDGDKLAAIINVGKYQNLEESFFLNCILIIGLLPLRLYWNLLVL